MTLYVILISLYHTTFALRRNVLLSKHLLLTLQCACGANVHRRLSHESVLGYATACLHSHRSYPPRQDSCNRIITNTCHMSDTAPFGG